MSDKTDILEEKAVAGDTEVYEITVTENGVAAELDFTTMVAEGRTKPNLALTPLFSVTITDSDSLGNDWAEGKVFVELSGVITAALLPVTHIWVRGTKAGKTTTVVQFNLTRIN